MTDIQNQIEAAKRAGYTATVEIFGEKQLPPGRQGILLNPGQIVLTIDQFSRFVADGCKEPAKYQAGYGFQAVLVKDINEILADLYEQQRPFVEPVSADVANQQSVSAEEMEGYARRKEQIAYLEDERIRIQKWFDSLTRRA